VKIFDLPIDDGRDYHLCVRSDSEMTEDGKLLQNGFVGRQREPLTA
jgi:hypothetical protein